MSSRRALADQVSQIGQGMDRRHPVIEVGIATDPQLLGRGSQGHKGIPSRSPLGRAGAETDGAFADSSADGSGL